MKEMIIFDMDGTLYSFEDGINNMYSTKFYEEIKDRGTKFIADRLSIDEIVAEKLRAEIFTRYDGNISIGLKQEKGIEREEYFDYVWNIDASKYMRSDSKLKELLGRIPYRKAVLSSAPKVWVQKALRQLDIFEQFDGIWWDNGLKKPDKHAYLQVTDAFNIETENVIMIDDDPAYLEPAKALGMKTVLIGSEKKPFIDYRIENIYGLIEVLEEE